MSTRAPTLVTPSAKSHERVTGRWTGEFNASSRKERLIYGMKMVIGSPIPWIIWTYVAMAFISRAGVEIAAWSCAILTFLYILVDRFSTTREFSFFRVGADFFLLGYALVALIRSVAFESYLDGLTSLGGVRWVLLIYLVTYAIELFPGLNRIFRLLVAFASLTAAYGIWQHFTGLDLLRDSELLSAPVKGEIFFISTSFFNTPEVLGTVLSMALPFPAAAFLMANRKENTSTSWLGLLLCAVLSLGVMWTYRPGLWMASVVAALIILLLQGRNALKFVLLMSAFIATVVFTSYDSPEAMSESVQAAETVRAERQRAQINTQVQLWQESVWVGVGRRALEAANYDPGTGNVYFQILAQSGVFGASLYLLFILSFMLLTYRLFQEIPRSHYWHRVLMAGALGSQIAFHIAGLYWSTIMEASAINLFVLMIASTSYLNQHYGCGLVSDDHSL